MKSLQIGVNDTEIEILFKLLRKPQKFRGYGGKLSYGLQNRDFDDDQWKNGKKLFSDYKPHLLELKTIYKIRPQKAHSPYGLTPIGICYLANYDQEPSLSDVKRMIEYLQNFCKMTIPIKELIKAVEEDDLISSFQHNCDIIRITKDQVFFNVLQLPSLTLTLEKHGIDEPNLFEELSRFLLRGFCFSIIDYYHHRMNTNKERLKATRSKAIIESLQENEEIIKNHWLKIPPKVFKYASDSADKISYMLTKQSLISSHYDDWYIKKNFNPKGISVCSCFS